MTAMHGLSTDNNRETASSVTPNLPKHSQCNYLNFTLKRNTA